jgi:hypothetical protein
MSEVTTSVRERNVNGMLEGVGREEEAFFIY